MPISALGSPILGAFSCILVAVSSCQSPPTTQEETSNPPVVVSGEPTLIPDTVVLSVPTIDPVKREQWEDYSNGIPLFGASFEPIDQAELNPNFFAFRDSLLAALANKDVDFVLDHLDPQIKMSYDVAQGKEDFMESWKLEDDPENSTFWSTMTQVLEAGGIFTSRDLNYFVSPYTFLLDLEDPYSYKAVLGTDVRIRNSPWPRRQSVGIAQLRSGSGTAFG